MISACVCGLESIQLVYYTLGLCKINTDYQVHYFDLFLGKP